jgi:hypothetical protein
VTRSEAAAMAIKETDYCYVLAGAWDGAPGDGITLERIFTKENNVEEIRLAWWQNGMQALRPADLDAPDWIPLFAKALKAGVLTDAEKLGMLKALFA